MTWKRESVIEFRHCEPQSGAAIHAESAEAVKDGSPRPDKSGLTMTWKRESVIEFRHCEPQNGAAIHAESAKAVKMDRHAPTDRDSR